MNNSKEESNSNLKREDIWEYKILNLNVNNKEVNTSSNPEKDSEKLKGSLSPDFIKQQFPQQYQAKKEPPPAIQLQNIMNTLGKEGWQFRETINLPNLVFLVFIRKIINIK